MNCCSAGTLPTEVRQQNCAICVCAAQDSTLFFSEIAIHLGLLVVVVLVVVIAVVVVLLSPLVIIFKKFLKWYILHYDEEASIKRIHIYASMY